jgi:hypothetical protein
LESPEGGYKKVIKKVLVKEAWQGFWEEIEKTFFGLHPTKIHPSEFRRKKIL